MNSEPRREPQRYYIEFENQQFELGPDNTLIYVHAKDKKYDHIYVQFPDDEDGQQRGHYIWRIDPKYSHQFEMMCSNLIALNVTMVTQNDVSEFDLKQWSLRFQNTTRQPENAPEKKIDEPEYKELTQRQERLIQFLAYALEKEHIVATDFDGEGDLYL